MLPGEEYYIKVTGGSYHYGYSSYTGSYKIGFTDFPAPPETVITDLIENEWVQGRIESESNGGAGEQWFKFIATSSKHYIYVKFNTMNCIAAELLDNNFTPVGQKLDAGGDSNATSHSNEMPVNIGDVYYIKVTGGSYHYGYSSYTGYYSIAFTSTEGNPD